MQIKIALLICIMLSSAACNLSSNPGEFSATYTPFPTDAGAGAIITEVPTQDFALPTLTTIPLPGAAVTSIPVTSVPLIGGQCEVYTTYSGNDPANVLSLRREPSAAAYQVYLVPTADQVLLLPETSEVEAGGYHWLNVIYEVTADSRYIGWIARDSFSTNGIRDPSIPTLSPTGQIVPC